jgi:flagellar basal-body rod protein FlgG
MAQIARQDVYANNLANANSVGFRRGEIAVGQFTADLAAAVGSASPSAGGAAATEAGLDLSQGPLTSTGRSLDLAINGPGFFTIQTPHGLAYTRDGRFLLDSQRRLITQQGYPVLGEQGPLPLPSTDFSVSATGEITCQGKVVGKLRLMTPVNPRPLGGNTYGATAAKPATQSTVAQGMLEQANVNAIEEMGRIMNGYRLYEANATALRYQDETLGTLMKVVEK